MRFADVVLALPAKVAFTHPQTQPHELLPSTRGERAGSALGATVGGVAGAAAPIVLGGILGSNIGEGLSHGVSSASEALGHQPLIDPAVDVNTAVGATLGGLSGAALSPVTGLYGLALGGLAGSAAGRLGGSMAEALMPQATLARMHARSMPLRDAYRHLVTARRIGAPPEVVRALEDDYNERRENMAAGKFSAYHDFTDAGLTRSPRRVGAELRNVGKSLGAIGLGLFGAAAPAAAIGTLGHVLGDSLAMTLTEDFGPQPWIEPLAASAAPVGAAGGAILGMRYLPLTMASRAAVGYRAGGLLGSLADTFVPEEPVDTVIDKVRRLPAPQAAAYFKAVESAGHLPPAHLNQVRQVYEARRIGAELQKGAAIDPLRDPMTRPSVSPNWRELVSSLLPVAGSGAGALLGAHLGYDMAQEWEDTLRGTLADPDSFQRPISSESVSVMSAVPVPVGALGGAASGAVAGMAARPLFRAITRPREEVGVNAIARVGYNEGASLIDAARASGVHPDIITGMERAHHVRTVARQAADATMLAGRPA